MASIARTRLVLAGRIVAGVLAVGFAVMAYVYLTLPDVRALATENPTTTAFMKLRADEAAREGRRLRHVQRWVPYSRISPSLKRAVLVAEDDAFFQHEGIDFKQLEESIRVDLARGRAVRGASTITQQLAKNLYLSPTRNPMRKVQEWIIARRMEAALSKTRIFEIYLNVIEWGDGVWGVEAAARTYFRTSAASLTPQQSALLAGAIVNPRVLSPAKPTRRLLRRQRIILGRMRGNTGESLADEEREAEEPRTEPSAAQEPAAAPVAAEPGPDAAPQLPPEADATPAPESETTADAAPE